MKLLVISGAFPPMASGEAANTFHLCRRLAAIGVEVHLLTTHQPRIEPIDGVKLTSIMRRWSWREAGKLRRVIRDTAPDAILLIYLGGIYRNHPMVTFTATFAKRLLPGVRFVTRFENPMFVSDRQGSLTSRALRKVAVKWAGGNRCSYGFGTLLRDSDGVIALCEYHLGRLRDEDPTIERKGVLIPPPANVSLMPDRDGALRARGRQAIAAPANAFVVGYLGYLYPVKGVETLLHAVALLVSQKLTVRLVILGGSGDVPGVDEGTVSYYDQMRQLALDLGLAGLTTWSGGFSAVGDDVAASIHAADAFVLPFDNGIHLNNSSLATLASYGVPVIATREHTDRAFIDQENVLLCPPRNPAAIAEAINNLISHPELAAKLRVGALALARDYFNWDTALQRTLNSLMAAPTGESSRFNRREPVLTPAPDAGGERDSAE
jgi:glycosyltransferase involved in cell wall biosynthesis